MDIQLTGVSSPDVILMDWLQTPVTGQIAEGPSLQAAVFVALLSDAIASPSDQLPDPNSDDLRGWWGDLDVEEIWGGWPLGSKLWLLTRTSIVDQNARTGATITRVQKYLAAALQPFVDNKICSKFTVTAEQVDIKSIRARVKMYRGPKSAIALEFESLWTEQTNTLSLPNTQTFVPPLGVAPPVRVFPVTLDANATAPFIANNSSTTTINFTNLTVGTGQANYALIAQFDGNNANGVASMTWGAQSLTRIASFTWAGAATVELWGLIAPASGNHTLAVILNSAVTFAGLNASSFYNVSQSSPFYNPTSNSASGSSSMSLVVTSKTNDLVIEVNGNNSGSSPHAPSGTQLFNGGAVSPAASYAPGAASVTVGWTAYGSTFWAMLGCSVRANGN